MRFTQAQLYMAFLHAAEHIKECPRCYDFGFALVPKEVSDFGCPLAWVGYFLNKETGSRFNYFTEVASATVLASEYLTAWATFCERMNDIYPAWHFESSICAAALRRYAERWLRPVTTVREEEVAEA